MMLVPRSSTRAVVIAPAATPVPSYTATVACDMPPAVAFDSRHIATT
jgi:hypothetical protein